MTTFSESIFAEILSTFCRAPSHHFCQRFAKKKKRTERLARSTVFFFFFSTEGAQLSNVPDACATQTGVDARRRLPQG